MGSAPHVMVSLTFNMGTGFMVVIDQDSKTDFVSTLKTRVQIKEIGHVENGTGIEIPKFETNLAGYY